MSGFLSSSIGKKFAMALSALFLMIFSYNTLPLTYSLFSVKVLSTRPPILWGLLGSTIPITTCVNFGVIFHFVMGFVLEIQNRKARQIKYAKNNGNANSSWMSRNMIWSGFAILAFIVLHFIDFWIPEMQYKYIDFSPENPTRYFHELVEKFHNPVKVLAYVIAFIFLILHLLHGFNSAFQSVGANNKYTKALKGFSKIYAIGIPLGFIFIALFHHFTGH